MMRGKAFHGFVSMPRWRRSWKVESRVDDLEIEVELPPKLVLPLPLEHGRAEDEDAADSPSQEQFFEHQPRLDRLAEAHAIGQQQADTGHRQGLEHRLQLVGVDLDGRVPDAQERLVLDVLALTQPVQPGPAVGVDERLQRVGAVGPVGIDARQRGRAQDAAPSPRLPRAAARPPGSASRRGIRHRRCAGDRALWGVIRLNGTHRRQTVADPHSLADLWILTGLDAPHVSALGHLVDPGSPIGILGSKRSSSMDGAV